MPAPTCATGGRYDARFGLTAYGLEIDELIEEDHLVKDTISRTIDEIGFRADGRSDG
jgi:hypothetical protein